MRHLQDTTLADVLVTWGRHEALGRFKHQLQIQPGTALECLNLLFHTRPRMVSHLLHRRPAACRQVELEPGDEAGLRLSNDLTLDEWLSAAKDQSKGHVDALVRAEEPPVGPVLAVAVPAADDAPGGAMRVASLILYDGWHRTAGWLLRCRDRRPSSLLANLVVVGRE